MTLEEKIEDLKANFDYVLEGKDLEIKELKDRLAEEVELHLHAEEYIKSLEKELAEWKEEWQEQVQKAIDEGYARTQQTIQLTKATALLKKFIETSNPIYFEEDRQKVKVDAEQFIKETEK